MALYYARQACNIFASSGNVALHARISAIAAEIALDLAWTYRAAPSKYNDYVEMANSYAKDAPDASIQASDPGGASLGILANARVLRFFGEQRNRVGMIIGVAKSADSVGDKAIKCHSFLTLSQESYVAGEYGPARGLLVNAVNVAKQSNIHAYSKWAMMELHRFDARQAQNNDQA